MEKTSMKTIWIMFTVFIVIFILNCGVKMGISATQRMFMILEIWATIISIVLLVKNKLPQKIYINISLFLSILVSLSYLNTSILLMIKGFVITLMSSLAVFGTFNKFNHEKLIFLNTKNKKSVFISILVGICVGLVLGIINYLFMSINDKPNLQIDIYYFVLALNPAIYEEILFRALFYAFCIYLVNGKIETKQQKFTCWFMMIMPHVIVHTPDNFIYEGIVSGVVVIIMYSFIFALPFAILQRKRDITSAMIAHGLVDVIRFCFFGLPF
jgi:hypothetical protein